MRVSGLLGLCRLVEMLERTWRRRRVKARTSADLWAVTTTGGTWRLAGCRDYWSKYEHPSVMIVTGNGGPFRSLNFELFIASGPELGHVRTPVKSPGANGPTERGLGTWEHERLYPTPSMTPSISSPGPRTTAPSTTPCTPAKPPPSTSHSSLGAVHEMHDNALTPPSQDRNTADHLLRSAGECPTRFAPLCLNPARSRITVDEAPDASTPDTYDPRCKHSGRNGLMGEITIQEQIRTNLRRQPFAPVHQRH